MVPTLRHHCCHGGTSSTLRDLIPCTSSLKNIHEHPHSVFQFQHQSHLDFFPERFPVNMLIVASATLSTCDREDGAALVRAAMAEPR